MKQRRRAREHALEALFYMDVRRDFSRQALDRYIQCFSPGERAAEFFRHLTEGVMGRRETLDGTIEQFSENWRVRRMAHVDRNILRIAIFEILYCPDIPPKVSINEAIDIGKKYGTDESGGFINGILDGAFLAAERGELAPDPGPPAEIPATAPPAPPLRPKRPEEPEETFTAVRGRPGLVKRKGGRRRPESEPESNLESNPEPGPGQEPSRAETAPKELP
jgi:N utilization substance protein B